VCCGCLAMPTFLSGMKGQIQTNSYPMPVELLAILRPAEDLTVSQWCDRHRYLALINLGAMFRSAFEDLRDSLVSELDGEPAIKEPLVRTNAQPTRHLPTARPILL